MVNEYVAPPPDPIPATIQPNMNAPNPGGMGSPSSGFDADGRYIGPGSGAPGSTLTYNDYQRGVYFGTIPNGNVYPVGSSDWYEYEIAMREMTARRNVASGNDTNYNTANNPPPGVIIPVKEEPWKLPGNDPWVQKFNELDTREEQETYMQRSDDPYARVASAAQKIQKSNVDYLDRPDI